MTTLSELLKKKDSRTIWNKYCGFTGLKWEEFNYVQERLLLEQVELMSECKLGKRIFGGREPKTVKDFRKFVPLTSFENYADYMLEKREDVLPDKTKHWICTSWKGTKDPIKWAPYSETMIKENAKAFMASVILATSENGSVNLKEGDRFFYGMAPLPYLTGLAPYGISSEINFEYLPELRSAENMSFRERNKKGFKLGLENGIDIFFGLSSVLVKIAESFSEQLKSGSDISDKSKVNLKTALRVAKGVAKSKVNGREILPKDIWNVKGIICAGTDTSLFKDKIEYYWGKRPLEIYGGTELSIVATEVPNSKGMLFFPDVNYLEFIPEEESKKSQAHPSYQPETVLLNELEMGHRYEIVTTKLKGGAFIRYRVGDLIRVVAPPAPENGIYLPQIKYEDRISNVIDLAGFTRLTESTIEDALIRTGIDFSNWIACKEKGERGPYLHLYIEPLKIVDKEQVKNSIHSYIAEIDTDFRDYELMLGVEALEVTVLPPATFKEHSIRYNNSEYSRMNPSLDYIDSLLKISQLNTAEQREVG